MHKNGLQYAPNSPWLFHLQRKEGTRLERDSQRGFSFYLEQSHLFLQKRRMFVYLPDIYICRKAGK